MNRTPLKRSPLKRQSEKNKEKKKKDKETTIKLHRWFIELWKKLNPKVCWQCGAPLITFSTGYFDHLLEKGKYPQFEFEEDNIFVCCLDCHSNTGNARPGHLHAAAIQRASL